MNRRSRGVFVFYVTAGRGVIVAAAFFFDKVVDPCACARVK